MAHRKDPPCSVCGMRYCDHEEGVTVTLSGNSTPLLPGCGECAALRARLAESEARAGRAEEAVRVLEKKLDDATEGLRKIVEAEPSCGPGGECFYEHFDGEGNPIGAQHVDPLGLVGELIGIARAARAAMEGAKP